MWRYSSSSRPAARYCCTTLAPPAMQTFFPAAAARACSSADSIPSATNVKDVPHQPFQLSSHAPSSARPPNMFRPMT